MCYAGGGFFLSHFLEFYGGSSVKHCTPYGGLTETYWSKIIIIATQIFFGEKASPQQRHEDMPVSADPCTSTYLPVGKHICVHTAALRELVPRILK